MPNVFKYSPGSTGPGVLIKGGFLIGNNTADYGGTFYSGITPSSGGSGGYTIYINKASGGPSIYTPANDSDLVTITNQQVAGSMAAPASYTTANQALAYYATQSDKVCVNRDYEAISTLGLVFNLDSGFTPSYPKGGSAWYDLTANGNNGSLINGASYITSGGGTILFDGIDDYVSLPQTSTFDLSGINFSINVWFNASLWNTEWQAIFAKGDNSWRVHRYSTSSPASIAFGTSGLSTTDTFTTATFNTNTWYNVTCIYDGTTKKIYVNGVLDNSANVTGILSNGTFPPNIGRNSQFAGGLGRFFNGSIPIAQIYNRALSASEVLQNFNAQKSRFGL